MARLSIPRAGRRRIALAVPEASIDDWIATMQRTPAQ
jgi:hypothetical protein